MGFDWERAIVFYVWYCHKGPIFNHHTIKKCFFVMSLQERLTYAWMISFVFFWQSVTPSLLTLSISFKCSVLKTLLSREHYYLSERGESKRCKITRSECSKPIFTFNNSYFSNFYYTTSFRKIFGLTCQTSYLQKYFAQLRQTQKTFF